MRSSGARISAACIVVGLVAFTLLYDVPAHSYLPEGGASGGTFTPDKWSSIPAPIQISTAIAAGAKLAGNTKFQTVIMNSLATWSQAPNFQSPLGTPTTGTLTAPQNGINLICFCSSGVMFNNSDGTLALTVTTTSGTQIIGANIFFNPQPSGVCFATDSSVTSCPNSGDAVQDLQTVATHEIGHFIGLDHSAVVRAVMFPFAPAKQTELGWDDVAGASVLYPKSAPDVGAGAISGKVSLNSGAVFGAHVFANSTTANNPFSSFPTVRKTPVGVLTDTSGNYTIQGLPPDTYEVIAEPLDGPVTNSNVDWASDFGQGSVATNFTTRWH
jgi:Matrixin